MIRIFLWPAPSASLGGMPFFKRILREPDGDVTAIAQRVVALRPISDFVESFLDLMATALVEFVGHGPLGRAV